MEILKRGELIIDGEVVCLSQESAKGMVSKRIKEGASFRMTATDFCHLASAEEDGGVGEACFRGNPCASYVRGGESKYIRKSGETEDDVPVPRLLQGARKIAEEYKRKGTPLPVDFKF